MYIYIYIYIYMYIYIYIYIYINIYIYIYCTVNYWVMYFPTTLLVGEGLQTTYFLPLLCRLIQLKWFPSLQGFKGQTVIFTQTNG